MTAGKRHSPGEQDNGIALARAGPSLTRPLALVVVATLIAFAPACFNDFTWWDDAFTVHQNARLNPPTLESLGYYWTHEEHGLFIPVTYTAWMMLARLGQLSEPGPFNVQLNPWVFHGFSVLAHTGTAVFAMLVLNRLVRRPWAACAGALVLALHPVQAESVAWVSGLKDVLAGLFGMIALWRYLVVIRRFGSSQRIAPDALGTVALVLGMLSKPSAAMIPLIAVALDVLLVRRTPRLALRATAVWMVMGAAALVMARLAQDVEGIANVPFWQRPLVAGDALAFYLFKLVFPQWLGIDYGRAPLKVMAQWHGWLNWLLPAGLAGLFITVRRTMPWLAAGGAVFVIALLPVLGLATFLFQFTSTTADHYLYVAMLGPAIWLAFALRDFGASRTWVIAWLLLGYWGFRSFAQGLFAWKNDETLFSNAIYVNPASTLARNNLGHFYNISGRPQEALEQFDAALRLDPDYSDANANRAVVLAQLGRATEAVQPMRRAIEIREKLPTHRYGKRWSDQLQLVELLTATGELDEAEARARRVLAEVPTSEWAMRLLNEIGSRRASSPPQTHPGTGPDE